MKTLVVYAHPNPVSFNHAILEQTLKTLAEKGHEVRVRDLYALGFEPVLSGDDLSALHGGQIPVDIKAEQDQIAWAERLVLIYPLWWASMPAILKGYIDRVLSYGFAYSMGPAGIIPLLKGKTIALFTTHGTPLAIYEQMDNYQAFSKTMDRGIWEFCGLEVVAHRYFGAVPSVDDAARKAYLADVATALPE